VNVADGTTLSTNTAYSSAPETAPFKNLFNTTLNI